MTPAQKSLSRRSLTGIASRLRDQRFTLTGCTPRNSRGIGRARILLARFGSPWRAVALAAGECDLEDRVPLRYL